MTIHAYISELFCLQTGGKKKNMMAREEVERMLFLQYTTRGQSLHY